MVCGHMRCEEFASSATGMTERHYPLTQVAALMKAPDDWARRFGDLLGDYLTGRVRLGCYEGKNLLANYLSMMWRLLLGMPNLPCRAERAGAQPLLALHASHMVLTRHRAHKDGQRHPPSGSIMMTETGTAILLVKMVLDMPTVVVMPAPPQFRLDPPHTDTFPPGWENWGVSLLVLSTRQRTVNPIHVQISDNPAPSGITVVTGDIDLGDRRLEPSGPPLNTVFPVPWPGLISAHYILNANLTTKANQPHTLSIVKYRSAGLAEAVAGTSNNLGWAVERLREPILAPLTSHAGRR